MVKIDVKSRMALPVGIRTSLPENHSRLVITNSMYKNRRCLDLYSFDSWLALEEKINKLPSLNANVQAFQRFYLSAGQMLDMDSQHRLLIPKNLRQFANLESELILVGMGNKVEIWDKTSWETLNAELSANFEEIQAAVADLEEDS